MNLRRWLPAVSLTAAFAFGVPQVRAQSFEIVDANLRVASLDGLWRFHTGDNRAWADANFDDTQWALLRSDQSWSTQGYKNYGGLAWYRFQVVVPAGLDHVSLYLPNIRTCYELYADGKLIGTYGRMPPNSLPWGDRAGVFKLYSLPAASAGRRTIQIAIRVWHWPGWATYYGGGPRNGGGLVGDSHSIEPIDRQALEAQRWEMSSVQTVGLLEALATIGAFSLFLLRRNEREYLWFGVMMLISAFDAWMAVSYQTHVWNVAIENSLSLTGELGADLALIAFLLALLRLRRTWMMKIAASLMIAHTVSFYFVFVPGSFVTVRLVNLLTLFLSLPYAAWVVGVVVLQARRGSEDARLLVAPIVLEAGSRLFLGVAWITYTIGWQHAFSMHTAIMQRPFPIELPELTQTLFLLAVFGILILRFTRTSSAEERYAGEVQAARSVQQYLIPEHLPSTPGLAIENEYRPAKEVGGDFFQVLPNASEGNTLIVVGDVAGHGMEAGMLATLVVGAIRTAAAFTTDPARILSLLNDRMQGRGLATCLALRIEKDGSAALANAGHLPPYLNGNEMAIEGSLPLGAIPGIDFPVLVFKLDAGDTLMLMTDGVAEAKNADGHLFGFDRIAEMLRGGIAAAALASAAQGFGQEDDITVLTVSRMA
ncbi:MAG: PP2C family protein-serine/threonine phosphatase [Terracidiphilus sp.]|jgi:hypothetical protein